MPLVSVVIPTHDHGPMLARSLHSVLSQSHDELEVFVIGDGVPAELVDVVRAATSVDPRVQLVERPKSPRTGEPYRDEVLRSIAAGEIVCYLSDDDLWLPDHVERMIDLLRDADFAHALPTWVEPDGTAGASIVDFADPWFRADHLAGTSRVALSFGAHTMEAYRRLPRGWETTPEGRYTDWFMWSKFLERDELRCISGFDATVIHMGGVLRRGMSGHQRQEEMDRWLRAIADPRVRLEFTRKVLAGHGGPATAARLQRELATVDDELQETHRRLADHDRRLVATLAQLDSAVEQ